MKRTIFLLAIALAMVIGAKAQQQTATLQRSNSTTYYYGEDAFKEAYNAANDGSVITLSAGYFNTVDSVSKQITIRGNGYTGEKTVIGVTVPEQDNLLTSLPICADNVMLDGLYVEKGVFMLRKIENLHVRRCFLCSIVNFKAETQNSIIDQCKIGFFYLKYPINCCVKNSYLSFLYINTPNILFMNSVIGCYHSNCSYRNCIVNVQNEDGHVSFNADQDYQNNVFICGVGATNISTRENGYGAEVRINESTRYSKPTIDAIETSNIKGNSVALFDDIFNYTNEENPLYAPIITTITGDDGTVVGPYGGTGFSENPSIPHITESKIDTYTDGEGKLNVKVKVEVGQ